MRSHHYRLHLKKKSKLARLKVSIKSAYTELENSGEEDGNNTKGSEGRCSVTLNIADYNNVLSSDSVTCQTLNQEP